MNSLDHVTFSADLATFDFAVIHSWLTRTYWSPGISREKVERGFRASTVCLGAFLDGAQIGVGRCLSDTTRFAYLADVFVAEPHRGRGVARALVRQLMQHPLVREAETWYLLTRDAHGVYAGLGFEPHPRPQDFMRFRKPD